MSTQIVLLEQGDLEFGQDKTRSYIVHSED